MNDIEFTENFEIAVLFKRLHTALNGSLIPVLYSNDSDQEIKRLLKLIQPIPSDSEQKLAFILSKL